MTELFALSKNELASKQAEPPSSLAEQAFNLLKENSTTLAVIAGATIVCGLGIKALARGGKVLGAETEATLATGEMRDALRTEMHHPGAYTSRNITPDGSPVRVSLGDNLSISRNVAADGSPVLVRHPAVLEAHPPVPDGHDVRYFNGVRVSQDPVTKEITISGTPRTIFTRNEHMSDVFLPLLKDFKPGVDKREWITDPELWKTPGRALRDMNTGK